MLTSAQQPTSPTRYRHSARINMTSRWPDHVWVKIFSLACTDGGATGAALSLTCKHLHSLSTKVKLQTVAVTSDKGLSALCTLLASLPTSSRMVKHLLIRPLPDDLENDLQLLLAASNEEAIYFDDLADEFGPQGTGFTSARDISHIRMADTRTVISLSARTLETLAFYTTDRHRQSIVPSICFSFLRDLTLPGRCLPSPSNASSDVAFPSLVRLHLCHFSHFESPPLHQTVLIAPGLQHLQLCGLRADITIATSLAKICGVHHLLEEYHAMNKRRATYQDYPSLLEYLWNSASFLLPRRKQPSAATPILQYIEKVDITGPERISAYYCGTGACEHDTMVSTLRLLEQLTRNSGLQFKFLPESEDNVRCFREREDSSNGASNGIGYW